MKGKNILMLLIANTLLAMGGSVFAQESTDLILDCGLTEQGYVGDSIYCVEAKISCGTLTGFATIGPGANYTVEASFPYAEGGCYSSGTAVGVAPQGVSWSCDLPEGSFSLAINEVGVEKCTEYCGDGIVQKPEQCDPAEVGGPKCTEFCKFPSKRP